MNVHIPLKAPGLFNVRDRLKEITEIREWIKELVAWDETQFKITTLSTYPAKEPKLIVWFEQDEHATLCMLRWS
jgi:hypothetical protein